MLQEQALAPLRRQPARKTSDDLHDDLARLEASVVDGMILNADKLTRMLRHHRRGVGRDPHLPGERSA